METLNFNYYTTEKLLKSSYVGVVGSGDLEILMEPADKDRASVKIRTAVDGFEKVWENVLDRFFAKYSLSASIEINDFGATPGLVMMRLVQALEVSLNEE